VPEPSAPPGPVGHAPTRRIADDLASILAQNGFAVRDVRVGDVQPVPVLRVVAEPTNG
jgi:hypothetical protein